ncbi:MAG: sigma 54-interacting transcriptional regulator [Candidatus Zixiibacteriota bacterium]|nr:MAG: sigma 54-interacting transcriptional regulator [candidate division Zixibacteria bacterium]
MSLETLLSQNDLSQSWVASCPASGTKSFVKTPNPESPIDAQTVSSILNNSYRCQRLLNSDRIITAKNKYHEKGQLFFEYPYLDSQRWQQLTPSLFWQNFDSVLVQLCLLVDLVHLRELVHCDLKLSNFMIGTSAASHRLVLVDLDFLTAVGSSPNAKIFGTPRHIAPEILSNDAVLVQSDNYSLGIAFKDCVEYYRLHPSEFDDSLKVKADGVEKLAELLTDSYPLNRPYALLNATADAGLFDSAVLGSANKDLLSSMVLSSFRDQRSLASPDTDTLKKSLIRANRILGLSDELLDDLGAVYSKSRAAAIRLFKSVVQRASVSRHGDYWHLQVSDRDLGELFGEIDLILEPQHKAQPLAGAEVVEKLIGGGSVHKETGKYLRSFLAFRAALDELEKTPDQRMDLRAKALKELGYLSQALGRLASAAEYYRSLVELNEMHSQVDLGAMYDLVSVATDLGLMDEANQLVERGIAQAKSVGDLHHELMFERTRAWLASIEGRHDEAEELLDSTIMRAGAAHLHEVEIKVHYARGIVYWRRGLFGESEKHLMRSFEVARVNGLLSKSISSIVGLAILYQELAQHSNVIRYGKMALKQIDDPVDRYLEGIIANSLANAYSRLCDHNKAEYWLQRSLASRAGEPDRNAIVLYYIGEGYIKCNRGDFEASALSLHKGLDVIDSTVRSRSAAKIYHGLAEVAMYQGKQSVCELHLGAGESALSDQHDTASLAELHLIDTLNRLYNGGDDTAVQRLAELMEILINCRGYYFAGLALFHFLINTDNHRAAECLEKARPLLEVGQQSRAPFFRALSLLVLQTTTPPDDDLAAVRDLKTIFRILETSGNVFLAVIVCRRIAEQYLRQSQEKLARKFLGQALRLATGMKNERMSKELALQIQDLSDETSDLTELIDSVHGISEILKNIKDYRQSLKRLVEFAVEQTGAERGVLLLRSEQSNKLRVSSFVECDESSLEDIADFSSTIPLEVARNVDPLIVDNALADKRTRNYKSIVAHNILSVICIPVTIENTVLGVLYLDHHTIPALFDSSDIVYVTTIANLMAVMVSTIQSYRDVSIINQQLVEDVGRSGNRQAFVTKDDSMLELFGKLPEIARTNAPVLIQGESGTGKEILCEMIHDLSLRSGKPLIKLNCAAIAGTLIESELFGVAANVATDVKEREGKFAAADGGTLLLDEIGDMPLEVQAKVLRTVEYQQFERVGSNKTTYTDIRFVYATNKDLAAMTREGKFRQDLLYRINTVTIEIPPLRERRSDIMLLIDHFVTLFSRGGRQPRFSTAATQALASYDWPGNVRELKNLIERCCIVYPGERIDVSGLPTEIQYSAKLDGNHRESLQLVEKEQIRKVLIKHKWNQSRASADLNIPLSTLRRKIKKYQISKSI